MLATILLNKKGLEKNGSEIGELITSRSQHKLYYDFALGLFYRNDNGAVETLFTKVEEYDSNKIENEISKLKKNIQAIATFNISVRLRV